VQKRTTRLGVAQRGIAANHLRQVVPELQPDASERLPERLPDRLPDRFAHRVHARVGDERLLQPGASIGVATGRAGQPRCAQKR
jgi:hypothetical protein